MFRLLLVEKRSPPSIILSNLYAPDLCCISICCIWVLVSLGSLTLLILHKCQCCWLKS